MGRVDAAVATGLLVCCAWLRPDVAMGMVVLGVAFVAMERRWPLVEQRILRAGWRTDVVHFVVDQVAAAIVVAALAAVVVPRLEPLLPDLDTLLDSPVRLLVAAAIGEVAGYWGHRAMHQVPCLWRLHAVHHSSPVMDWLAPNRRHVLDTALGQAASVIPLLALGLSAPVVVSAFVLRRAQGLFVHANLRIRLPGLRWLIATPEFHHWHHSADPAHHDRNFAGQSPIIDWMFGTLHMPRGEWPATYGLAPGLDVVPSGYVARLQWPFRGVRVAQLRPMRVATATLLSFVAVGTMAGVSAALSSSAVPANYTCALTSDAGTVTVAVNPDSVVVQRPAQEREVVSVVHVDGDPTTALGLRVIAPDSTPMTILIGPGPIGATVAASMSGADGEWSGACTRQPDR